MRVRATYQSHGRMADAAAWAQESEQLGFDAVQFPELARNPFTALALAAQNTESVRLGTGVAVAFARSPYVAASLAWDLQEYSRGRLVVGLGTQVRAHNERRFSVPWGPPNARLREYIAMMRAVWRTWRTGEQPAYEGEHYRYTLDSYLFNPGPIDYPDPRIMVAATRPNNTRLAAEVADGVFWNHIVSWTYRDQVLLPALEAGARAAGKDPKDLIISGAGFIVTARDEEGLEAELQRARRGMAFYGSTAEYQEGMRLSGLEREGALLHLLSAEGLWADMLKVVDDEFVEQVAVVATWDDLPGKVAERYAGVNTEIDVRLAIETPDDEAQAEEVIAGLKAIPPYGEVARPGSNA